MNKLFYRPENKFNWKSYKRAIRNHQHQRPKPKNPFPYESNRCLGCEDTTTCPRKTNSIGSLSISSLLQDSQNKSHLKAVCVKFCTHGKPIQLESSQSQDWCVQSVLPRPPKQIPFEISMCLGNTTSFMLTENQFNWKAVNVKTRDSKYTPKTPKTNLI